MKTFYCNREQTYKIAKKYLSKKPRAVGINDLTDGTYIVTFLTNPGDMELVCRFEYGSGKDICPLELNRGNYRYILQNLSITKLESLYVLAKKAVEEYKDGDDTLTYYSPKYRDDRQFWSYFFGIVNFLFLIFLIFNLIFKFI